MTHSLKSTVVLLCAALSAYTASAQPRHVVSLHDDWRFIRQDVVAAESASYNDAAWEKIALPHTWNALDGQDGGNDYYRGIGWYRKNLHLDNSWKGKNLFLKFNAASTVAHVYLNGKLAGMHKGGFSAFCFDITSLVRFDAPNLLAVKVNNAHDFTVAPLRGDFTISGGLYRGVQLLVLNDLSISPLDFGSSGVYLKQSDASHESATIHITSHLRNGSSKTKTATVVASIRNHEGRIVERCRSTITIPLRSQRENTQRIILRTPHLWDGKNNPYLYRAHVKVYEGRELKDSVAEPLGLRFFRVDADSGFFLNGKPYRLHGVNRHQDRQDRGWAIGIEEFREDDQLIEEIGATAVRLAHYQHAKEFHDLCDQRGRIVWAEVGLVDFVSEGEEFEANIRQQLTELIKQNFNHPSIFFWGLFNELIPDKNRELYGRIVVGLNRLAHQLDPTRLTTVASRSMYDGTEFINSVTDLVAYNVYKGWYEEMPEDFARYADALRKKFPDRRIGIGEYGAGAGTTQHEVPPQKPKTTARWHPEEWQNVYHEAHWMAITQRPFLWGTYVWNMFDFASDSRLEGELPGRNDKGLVTFDRNIRKDAFFWYKANWNAEPMVYITSRRFTPRPAGPTEVKVYSNCDTVAAYLNGKNLGAPQQDGRLFRWHPIDLAEGRNMLEVVGKKANISVTDSCLWQANPPTQK